MHRHSNCSPSSISKGPQPGRDAEANLSLDDVDAKNYAALVIPGGNSPGNLEKFPRALEICREFMAANKPVAAVCHGPRLLVNFTAPKIPQPEIVLLAIRAGKKEEAVTLLDELVVAWPTVYRPRLLKAYLTKDLALAKECKMKVSCGSLLLLVALPVFADENARSDFVSRDAALASRALGRRRSRRHLLPGTPRWRKVEPPRPGHLPRQRALRRANPSWIEFKAGEIISYDWFRNPINLDAHILFVSPTDTAAIMPGLKPYNRATVKEVPWPNRNVRVRDVKVKEDK